MDGAVIPLIRRKEATRYIGDRENMRLHDLSREDSSCDIDGLISSGNAVVFHPDALLVAMGHGYTEAHDCVVRQG